MKDIIRKLTTLFVCMLLFLLPLSAKGWEVLQHTDEFGDVIENDWFAWTIIDDAVMSNSATAGSDAVIVFKMETPNIIQVQCHDYGLHNSAQKFYIDDYVDYSFKDDSGRIMRLRESTKYDTGDVLGGINAIIVRDMMLNSEYVKVAVSGDRSKYVFTVDTHGFEQILTELCKKQLYTDDEIADMMDIEKTLYKYVFDVVLREMNPYNYDKSALRAEVYDFSVQFKLEDIQNYYPEYYEGILLKFQSKTYEEWINYFSTYYAVDITRIKNMKSVEKVFQMLGVPITRLEKARSIVEIDENGEAEDASEFNSFDDLVEASGAGLPETPKFRYAERSFGYLYVRSYGLGLTSRFGTDPVSNDFSMGLSCGFGGAFEKGSPHCLFTEISWLYNGESHAFEELLNYGYRKGLSQDLEMIVKLGLAFNMKTGLVKTPYVYTYDDGISNGFMMYFGAGFGLQFNYFFDQSMFLTFGVSDRILGPGLDLLGYEELNSGVDNLLEAFIGIGTAF